MLILCVALGMAGRIYAQSPEKADQVIEGGKIIVELVKALSLKKQIEKDPGCKGRYADLCIENNSMNSITAYLEHRVSRETREVIILPEGKECVLQASIGVWTYDLRVSGEQQSLRKGDLRIEGCQNLIMNIK